MSQKRFRNEDVNTVIGEDTHIQGILHSQRSIRVEGRFEGEINVQGQVVIGENSIVEANIVAKQVIVAGQVIGNIQAINGLYISRTGKVYGNISGDQLTIEEGAVYRGEVNMDVISAQNLIEGPVQLQRKQK